MKCPHCGEEDTIAYVEQLVYERFFSIDDTSGEPITVESESDSEYSDSHYECSSCGTYWEDWSKLKELTKE